jgi:hypothetical protein
VKKFVIVYLILIALGLLYSYTPAETNSVSLPIRCKNVVIDAGQLKCIYGIKILNF